MFHAALLFALFCVAIGTSTTAPLAVARDAGTTDDIRAGAKLFRHHCAHCHGPNAEGTRRAPDLRSSAVQNTAPEQLFAVLTDGKLTHGMPSWSRLPEERRRQLVIYIKSLGH
jgi:ubiquinol-cytochrome c reductase cytochrome c subunit